MTLTIYAIKTDGLKYFIGKCIDQDEVIEPLLIALQKSQAHKDTVRFELVPSTERPPGVEE